MIVGIDLGTTNSLISFWNGEKPELIPNSLGNFLTPSVVAFTEEGNVLVGKAAKEQLSTKHHKTHEIFKRYMGTNKEFQLGNRFYRAEELSSFVLKSLKEDANFFLKTEIKEAIITVPAYFNDTQRRATKLAAEHAGLKVKSLLNEPTAAALTYGIHNQNLETKFLVFDLGGGTFDVSVLELFEGVIEVRASAGDNHLGGEDFLQVLIDIFFEKNNLKKTELKFDQKFISILRQQLEKVKLRLSIEDFVEYNLEYLGKEYNCKFYQDEFQKYSETILERLRKPVERALRDARIKSGELSQVVLAGGATRIPSVRKMVAKMFGIMPSSSFNPDEIVALGAGVQAGLSMKKSELKEIVLTDVCPYTLGIEVSERMGRDYVDGFYYPIIDRNTLIPVSKTRPIKCIDDNQRKLTIKIYQGEARLVKENVYLGQITVDFPPLPATEAKANVRFTYDTSGVLEVEVHVIPTDKKYISIIEENPGLMSKDQIEERFKQLSKLKIHPRDQYENKLLLNQAEKLYEELLGVEREILGSETRKFTVALETQDPEKIEPARKLFKKILEEMEPESFL
ncbi:MAG: molecular chaperone HscC [Leptospiraceae bacterium]|nr:molecular chaperone HscC [Leptospiraceae bacterium]